MSRIEKKPKISDYELTFKVNGLSFLFTDMLTKGFKYLHPLFTSNKNGDFRQYFTNDKMGFAGKHGLKWLSKEGGFLEYKKEFYDYHIRIKKELSIILERKRLSKTSITKFFRLLSKMFTYYSKMDFQFTNLAYLYKTENVILSNNLKLLSEFKDNARVWINEIALTDDSEFKRLIKKLSEQFGISTTQIENYRIVDLIELFNDSRVSEELMNKRKDSYTIFVKNNRVNYLEGEDSYNQIETYSKFENEQVEKILKGQIANKTKSKIKGQARVINVDYSDFSKMEDEMNAMKQGEILISEFTAPELMNAIEKASAIVTDLGGMLSHAAIISRERGIPCLVATKSASKAFHDGENVIVDLERGIIMSDEE